MLVTFQPRFQIGDIVKFKIDLEKTYIVSSYTVYKINTNKDEVSYFTYNCIDKEGSTYTFIDSDLIEG